jgi:type VI secretion system protein ImpA
MAFDGALLLQPIPGLDDPAGEDLRYAATPIYSKIKDALTEVDLPQEDGTREHRPADLNLAIRLASEALTSQSKDLQVATWLTEAMLRRDGVGGLRHGLDLIRAMLETFWESVYPKVEDNDLEGRAAPLGRIAYLAGAVRMVPLNHAAHTLHDYTESRKLGYEKDVADDYEKLEKRKALIEREGRLTPEEFDGSVRSTPKDWYKTLVADLEGAVESLEALDRLGEERFGREAPSYTPLRDALQEVRRVARQLLDQKLAANPDPVAAAPAIETVLAPAGDAGAAPVRAVTSPAAAAPTATPAEMRSRDDAAAHIAAAARLLRKLSPADPAPYLMLRGFRWGELRGSAALDPRLLAAPSVEVRVRLKSLMLDGSWAELLETAEEVMATPSGRGWLDLQRYVLRACDALGGEYATVGTAVRGALRQLLRDRTDLVDQTLMDDSAAANPETRAWLRDEGLLSREGEEETSARPAHQQPQREPVDQLLLRARGGQPQKAIEFLLREAAREESPRARFLLRAQAASIMVDTGLDPVAMPILRDLVEQIEAHSLEGWESSEVVARPLGLLVRCIRRVEGETDEANQLYLRVCRLDPLQAIRLTSESSEPDTDSDSSDD